ncbi:MAG: hypothetical protein WDN10_03500 [bacterium]
MSHEVPKLNQSESKEKPPVLYHGTANGDIKEFEPRSAAERPDEEPAVYASPDREIAIQSMANKFVTNGGIVNGRKFVCIPMTREEFIEQDHGGTVYSFPSDSFEINKGIGLGDKEWVSRTTVKPRGLERFPSLLAAMLKQGTEVYFIKPEMVSVISKAQDSDPEELERLLGGLERAES